MGGGGVRVAVNEEVKFLGKFTIKKFGGGGREGRGSGDVGYGGCEPRIEGIVQCTKRYITNYITKRYCTILRK